MIMDFCLNHQKKKAQFVYKLCLKILLIFILEPEPQCK